MPKFKDGGDVMEEHLERCNFYLNMDRAAAKKHCEKMEEAVVNKYFLNDKELYNAKRRFMSAITRNDEEAIYKEYNFARKPEDWTDELNEWIAAETKRKKAEAALAEKEGKTKESKEKKATPSKSTSKKTPVSKSKTSLAKKESKRVSSDEDDGEEDDGKPPGAVSSDEDTKPTERVTRSKDKPAKPKDKPTPAKPVKVTGVIDLEAQRNLQVLSTVPRAVAVRLSQIIAHVYTESRYADALLTQFGGDHPAVTHFVNREVLDLGWVNSLINQFGAGISGNVYRFNNDINNISRQRWGRDYTELRNVLEVVVKWVAENEPRASEQGMGRTYTRGLPAEPYVFPNLSNNGQPPAGSGRPPIIQAPNTTQTVAKPQERTSSMSTGAGTAQATASAPETTQGGVGNTTVGPSNTTPTGNLTTSNVTVGNPPPATPAANQEHVNQMISLIKGEQQQRLSGGSSGGSTLQGRYYTPTPAQRKSAVLRPQGQLNAYNPMQSFGNMTDEQIAALDANFTNYDNSGPPETWGKYSDLPPKPPANRSVRGHISLFPSSQVPGNAVVADTVDFIGGRNKRVSGFRLGEDDIFGGTSGGNVYDGAFGDGHNLIENADGSLSYSTVDGNCTTTYIKQKDGLLSESRTFKHKEDGEDSEDELSLDSPAGSSKGSVQPTPPNFTRGRRRYKTMSKSRSPSNGSVSSIPAKAEEPEVDEKKKRGRPAGSSGNKKGKRQKK